jgi:hypothetical protein
MIARGALYNLSIFNTGPVITPMELAKEFMMRVSFFFLVHFSSSHPTYSFFPHFLLLQAVDFELSHQPTKYTAGQMLTNFSRDPRTVRMSQGKTMLAVWYVHSFLLKHSEPTNQYRILGCFVLGNSEPYEVADYYREHLRKKEMRNNKTIITAPPSEADEE